MFGVRDDDADPAAGAPWPLHHRSRTGQAGRPTAGESGLVAHEAPLGAGAPQREASLVAAASARRGRRLVTRTSVVAARATSRVGERHWRD